MGRGVRGAETGQVLVGFDGEGDNFTGDIGVSSWWVVSLHLVLEVSGQKMI